MKVNDSFREIVDNTSERSFEPVYSMFVTSIENELHEFDREMPAQLEGSHLLQTHYAAVFIRLLEPFYHGGRESMLGLAPAHLRCRRLWDCVQSTQEMYEGYVALLSERIPFYTFVPILHAALATFKTFRLLWFKDEAWDLDSVRERFDLPGFLQLVMQYFEDASREEHPRCQIMFHGRPIFSEYAEVYRAIERGYEAKVKAEQEQSSPTWKELLDACQDDASFWPGLFDLTDVLGS